MKKLLKPFFLLIVPVFSFLMVKSQSVTSQVSTNFLVEAYNIRGRPIVSKNPSDVEGSPLLSDDWSKGTVYFKDGGVAGKVDLKFNLEKNELYFNRNGELFLFNDPVSGFRMDVTNDGQSKEYLFRSGYPVHGRFSKETLYEVIADGSKFQLVNYKFSYPSDIYVYGSTGSKKKYTPAEEIYVFDVAYGKMTKVKRNESAIAEALPDLKVKINQICTANKLKLKTNDDLIKLFELLNN